MFCKKSSGNKSHSSSKNSEASPPKGALLTPPNNLYIPQSHFVPDSQYVPEQQYIQEYVPVPESAYHQEPSYQENSYQPMEPSYQSMESSYLGMEPNYSSPQEPTQISHLSEPVNMGGTQPPVAIDHSKVSQPVNKPPDNSEKPIYPIDSLNVKVLFDGYSKFVDGDYFANCTCTLIKGGPNIIIDTMTVWDEEKLIAALRKEGLTCDNVDFVICTHGHSDHTGCNHLFKNAIHIVGFSVSHKDQYYLHPDFRHGEEFNIDPGTNAIKIIPTPGHTLQDVTVLVHTNIGTIAISGDLFEKAEDLENDYEWLQAGSDNASLQRRNRQKVLEVADFIIPGHGPIFKVPEKFKKALENKQANNGQGLQAKSY